MKGQIENMETMKLAGRTVLAVIALALLPSILSAQPPAGVVEYYHTDALGSVRAVTDATGTVARRHDYFAFGELAEDCATQPDTTLFTGQQRDRESCLDYFNARYYANRPGRFTTADPAHVGGSIFDPQSWNAYAYARNNPLRFIDPAGTEYVTWGTGTGMATASDLQFSAVFSAYDPNVLVRGSRESGELWVRKDNDWVFAGYYQQTKVDPTFNSFVKQTGDRANDLLKAGTIAVGAGAVVGATGGLAAGVWGTSAGQGLITLGGRQALQVTRGGLNRLIGESQRKILDKWFLGKGGPQGLSRRTLELYREIIRRYPLEAKPNPEGLAVQAARLKMIEELLKTMK